MPGNRHINGNNGVRKNIIYVQHIIDKIEMVVMVDVMIGINKQVTMILNLSPV